MTAVNPAVAEARNHKEQKNVFVSTDGVKYSLHPVAPGLMDAVTNRLKPPAVPMWHNQDMDRDEPNPSHPDYILALEEFNRKRGNAVYDAMVMFGIRLVDGLPEDETWLKNLQYMAKRGLLDLSEYDLEDALDVEFIYKRFVLATGELVNEIGNLSALTAGEVKAAGASFPGN